MTENCPLADLLGIDTVEDSVEWAVARLTIREEHKTPTGVVHSGAILSLADNCTTFMANRANNDGPNPDAFMVLIDLHLTMLGNQSEGVLTAESRVVRCGRRVTVIRTVVTGGNEKTLADVTTTHIPA